MLDTLVLSLRLKNAYRINSILYRLRFLHLSYESPVWKGIGLALALLKGLVGIFLPKLLYFGLMFLLPLTLADHKLHLTLPAGSFFHILVFLTLIGGLSNNDVVSPDRDKYYAVFLLRMDPRRYTLVNYGCDLAKTMLGFWAGAVPSGLLLHLPLLPLLLAPVLMCGVKLCCAAGYLALFRHRGELLQAAKPSLLLTVNCLLFAAAYGLPLLGWALPVSAYLVLCALLAAGSIPAALYLFRYDHYRRLYHYLFAQNSAPLQAQDLSDQQILQEASREQFQSKLTLEAADNQKTGCAYFNQLFFRRNRRLLLRPARITALAAAAVLAAACIACRIWPSLSGRAAQELLSLLPTLLFLMYAINRGSAVTQTFFFNCDCSMLSYAFYRRPDVVLRTFTARLRSLVAINLLPAAAIAVGLPLLLLCAGGTDRFIDYAVLFLSPLAMSVFFSVHYLVLYYLLQPFTVGLENKSLLYRILTGGTYAVCYGIFLWFKGATVAFGIVTILFAAAYVGLALLLVYRLAPRTFRLRI